MFALYFTLHPVSFNSDSARLRLFGRFFNIIFHSKDYVDRLGPHRGRGIQQISTFVYVGGGVLVALSAKTNFGFFFSEFPAIKISFFRQMST